jgi:hypothetical protein
MKKIGFKKFLTQPHKIDSDIYIDILYISICILVSLIHQSFDPQDMIAKFSMLV